jgi:hypothetical protein
VVENEAERQRAIQLAAFFIWLDGEGALKALHTLFQVFNFARLFSKEEVFSTLESGRHLGVQSGHILLRWLWS